MVRESGIYFVFVEGYSSEPEKVVAWSASDAVEVWCKDAEENGAFSGGEYPQHDYADVTHPDGKITRHEIVTDWSADYYVYDVKSELTSETNSAN